MSMTAHTFYVGWPPSGQHQHGQSGKRRFLTTRAKDYRQAVAAAYVASRGPLIDGPLAALFYFMPPSDGRKAKVDVADNGIKGIKDALQGFAYANDSQVKLSVTYHAAPDPEGVGCVRITLWPGTDAELAASLGEIELRCFT